MRISGVLITLLLVFEFMAAYEIEQINRNYIDEDRDNRLVGVQIFYPADAAFDSTFTLLVFGHGWLMPAGFYADFAQEISAEGYIVAFPLTEGNLFPDHSEFALDLIFTGESVLEENEEPDSPLLGRLNSRILVMGHSMGGGCSVLACSQADIFDAVINFAAAETAPSAVAAAQEVHCPSLVFAAENDNIAPPASHQIPIYENLASDYKVFINIYDEDHLGITGNALLSQMLLPFLEFITQSDPALLIEFESTLSLLADNDQIEYDVISSHYPYFFGDVDDNGEVEAYDSALVLQYAVGIDPAPAAPLPWENWRFEVADVSDDQEIDAFDASLILQYFTGIIDFFPAR